MAVLARGAYRATLRWRGACLLLALLLAGFASAQDDSAALQIKAAFLHKFATYVQGPGTAFERTDTPLVFGVAGSESVYDFLTQLVAAQSPGVRAAEVRRVTSVAGLDGVHVLYVGQDASGDAALLLQQAVQASMLTVTDLAGPQPPGSMIHFFVADDRVRFDIALAPATAAGLGLSSRLLQIARQVSGNQAP